MPPPRTSHLSLLRSIALPVVVSAGLLLLVLASLVLITSRSLERTTPLEQHLQVVQRVQDQILAMQHVALRGFDPSTPVERVTLALLHRELAALTLEPGLLTQRAHHLLASALVLLESNAMAPHEALLRGIGLLHEALVEENHAHTALLHAVQGQARLEKRLAAVALVSIPLAALLVLFLLRRRFLLPLANLNALLTRLGEGRYTPAELTDIDPVLEPLVANYNQMTTRLARLEAERQARQAALEAEVKAATRELLAHNRSLAQAERLAAVGEMAASMAHELRNPLAGVQMALANLRQELGQGQGQGLSEGDAGERLDLVANELTRITGLMNSLLDQARLTPEADTPVALAQCIDEVLVLARYQLPSTIQLHAQIPEGLCARLPEGRLRQALLNLALNAAQVMPDGGEVSVSAGHDERHLWLAVTDQGPGFPAEVLQRGVRPFASARQGGTGLGLATVRRLAQDLGGSLRLENLAPQGARVTLELPYHPGDAP